MKFLQKAILLALFASAGHAGTNPVQANILQPFPGTVLPTASYVALVSFTNHMPFPLKTPLVIEKNASPMNEFTYDDACSNKVLKYLEQCIVAIYLSPETIGPKTIQLTEAYGNDRVRLQALSTSSSTNGITNPNITGAITTALPSTLNIGTGAPFKFTFTNNGEAEATGISIRVTGAQYNTNCTATLSNTPPNNTCEIEGTFTPTASGIHTVKAELSYTQGSAINLQTQTSTDGQSGGLVCSRAVPLASQTLINSSSPVTLLCTNKTGSNITIDNHMTSYPTGGAEGNFTPDASGGDNCTAQILANNAGCQLKGTYQAPGAPINDVVISLLVNYHTAQTSGLSSSISTNTDVVTQITNARTIHLVNQCNFKVWWSMVGGALPGSCSTTDDCPSGATCNTAAKLCYFNNYPATEGSYELAALKGRATTRVIATDASTVDNGILWKGLISASTNCSGTTCQNNSCQNSGGTTSCPAGVGFDQPATVAEFTFKLTEALTVDSYDVSNVNGFSMPISMSTNRTALDYTCGNAGNPLPAGNLKACQFKNITPPSNMYYWVSNTGTSCNSQNTCTNSEQICGLAFDASQNNFSKQCGSFLGFWSADTICGISPNFQSPFGDNFRCNLTLGSPFPDNTYTLTQLLLCSPPDSTKPLFNSCYLSYSGATSNELRQCCGCSNWSGIATPSAACPAGQIDPQWTQHVEPIISWMKQACPTSYAYPYDDKASSFQCESTEATEYTITFCPGGETGLPNGKKDGRKTG